MGNLGSSLVILLTLLAVGVMGAAASAPHSGVAAADGMPQTGPLVHEGVLNAPPSEVWKVFSTEEGFKAFGVAHCRMDLRPGGSIQSHYKPDGVIGDDGTITNMILAYEPERMISIRIAKPPAGFPFPNSWQSPWTVITLTELGDGRTHLRMAALGYGEDEESQKMREFFKAGNAWSLQKLQQHFDAGVKVDPASQAHASDPLAPVETETIVNAPRAAVWTMLTSSAGWESFLGVESRIEARPGDPFEVYFSMEPPAGQRGSEGCTVLSVLPQEMISWSWNAPPKFKHARQHRSWVVVRLDAVSPTRTRVRLSNLGFAELAAANTEHAEEWKEVRAYFASAWPRVLSALQAKFGAADGTGQPAP